VRGNPYGAARALLAFRDGDRDELGMVGAMLWAEHIHNNRLVVEFLKSLGKGSGGAAPRRSGLGMRGRKRR
jgi:hypothetical protein